MTTRRPWTVPETEIVRRWVAGEITRAEAFAMTGRSPNAIRQRAGVMGFMADTERRRFESHLPVRAKLVELAAAGQGISAIARALGVSRPTIRDAARRLDITIVGRPTLEIDPVLEEVPSPIVEPAKSLGPSPVASPTVSPYSILPVLTAAEVARLKSRSAARARFRLRCLAVLSETRAESRDGAVVGRKGKVGGDVAPRRPRLATTYVAALRAIWWSSDPWGRIEAAGLAERPSRLMGGAAC